jgi:hypothetical protein
MYSRHAAYVLPDAITEYLFIDESLVRSVPSHVFFFFSFLVAEIILITQISPLFVLSSYPAESEAFLPKEEN